MTLGQIFKQKRQESGRSLEQLAALTKIHIKILTALEADSYETLPARAFTRGFVVNYAKALKLDSEQILKDHHDFLEQHFQERKDRDQGHQGYVFEGKELEQNRRWMTIGATVAVVFAAATLFIFKPQNHKHKELHKEFEEETKLDADGDPVEAPIPPPTLKDAPTNTGTVIPYALVTSSPATPTSSASAKTATANSTPLTASSNLVSATPAPAKTTPSATPNPTATPRPSASPTPAAKVDTLNKGDDLSPKDTKYKITFQAKEDLYVRYQSDDKPANMIILRKDRYLAIKAKTKLLFETAHPELLRYKTKGGYLDLTIAKGGVDIDANVKENSGANLGSSPVPADVPSPPKH